jgi:hypothetical protein
MDIDTVSLRIEAMRLATGLHCSPAATTGKESSKPSDVVDTASKIYNWLKKGK